MKKLLAIILSLTLVLCFVGCDKNEDNNSSGDTTTGVNESGENTTNADTNQISGGNNASGSAVKSTCVKCGAECKEGHLYCHYDECYDIECTSVRKDNSIYCVNHSCLLCDAVRAAGTSYCSKHKCARCENAAVDGSRYCVSHKCLICDREAFGSSSYCSSHD